MSSSVNGTTITLTRGDTFKAIIGINDADGLPYVLNGDEKIRFACKKKYTDEECLIEKVIPTDSLIFQLDPEDTKPLSFGTYVYDIQITLSDGSVDTFIPTSKLVITEEVE